VAKESIVVAVSIIKGEQLDVYVVVHSLERDGNILSDAMIPATHKLAQHNVTLSDDCSDAILETT
jgi:hypothetical protein